MLRLAAGQARHSIGRLAAAGLAIVLAAAFLSLSLMTGAVVDQGTREVLRSRLGGADVVVMAADEPIGPDDLQTIRGVDGVAAADPELSLMLEAQGPDGVEWITVATVPTDPALLSRPLQDGRLPDDAAEAALSARAAESLGLQTGDVLTLVVPTFTDDAPSPDAAELTVVGLTDDLPGVQTEMQHAVTLTEDAAWELMGGTGEMAGTWTVLVRATAAADPDQLGTAIASALPVPVGHLSADAYVEQQLAWFTGTGEALTIFAVTFGALAMVVAALVIGNTFQVLVAQRTRTLALLRCVGATRTQVRRSVIVEAVGLGLVAGPVGVLLGYGILLGVLRAWGGSMEQFGVALPTWATITPLAVILPLVIAVAVTVIASLAPARLAGRVAPLAAMRPEPSPDVRRASRGRRATTIVLLAAGLLCVGGAVAGATVLDAQSTTSDDALLGVMLLLVLGGALLAGGLMAGLVFVVPTVAGWIGRAVGAVVPRGARATVRLGTANAVRNPHRTAATAMALVIGITLVTVVTTGASSVRASLDRMLDSVYPADIVLYSPTTNQDGQSRSIDTAVAGAIAAVDGVEAVGALTEVSAALVDDGGRTVDAWVTALSETAAGLTAEDGLRVVPRGELHLPADWSGAAFGMVDGVPEGEAPDGAEIADGAIVELVVPTGWDDWGGPVAPGPDAPAVELTVVLDETVSRPLVNQEDLDVVAPGSRGNSIWVAITDGADETAVVTAVEEAIQGVDTPAGRPYAYGAAIERADIESAIDTVMLVIVGLLGVSVLIALVGVTNTLSLSVIERRREIAMLRAVGMTRGGIRGSLVLEGVLLAVVGAVVGTVAGIGLGWAASYCLLVLGGDPALAVPWAGLGITLVIAVVAGVLAAVLPARAALRVAPVAALGSE